MTQITREKRNLYHESLSDSFHGDSVPLVRFSPAGGQWSWWTSCLVSIVASAIPRLWPWASYRPVSRCFSPYGRWTWMWCPFAWPVASPFWPVRLIRLPNRTQPWSQQVSW